MKLKFKLSILILVLKISSSSAQMAYYDAFKLDTLFSTLDTSQTKFNEINNILIKYLPNSIQRRAGINSDVIQIMFGSNPFIPDNYKDFGQNHSAISSSSFSLSSIVSTASGLPITNFADGAAKFLVKRFKEELTIAFFQKFKDEISKVDELRTLFPETYKVLLVINTDIYKFSIYLNMLRESFIKDLTNLYTDFKKLTKLDKYKKYFSDHPEAYTIIINSLYFIDQYSRGQHPGEVLAKYNLEDLNFSDPSLQHNIRSSLSLLQAFSASFKSVSADYYWVPADSVKNLLSDPIERNIYFGLMYQKYGAISFYKTNNRDTIRFDTLLVRAREGTTGLSDSLNEYKTFIETFSDHAQEVGEYLSDLKGKKKEEIDYNDYYKLYNASFDLLEHGLTFIDLPYVTLAGTLENKIRSQTGKLLFVARNTGDLYVDVRTKNYSSAILNVTSILDTALFDYHNKEHVDSLMANLKTLELKLKTETYTSTYPHASRYRQHTNKAVRKFSKDENATYPDIVSWLQDKNVDDPTVVIYTDSVILKKRELKASDNHLKLKSTLLKYGSFASSVAQAQNSDDVEKAIESIALPSGSASIKKNSSLNIALNAYLGGFYGNEFLGGSPGKKWAPITGVYAPIGVTISTPVKFLFKKPGSLSGFFSVIDIGAFASFRLQDDTTKALPEISLKNIFAPGAGIVYGFPGLPLSLGWTWQYGPMLRELNRKDNDININASNKPNHRWQFFLAVDIPIINFYNKSK